MSEIITFPLPAGPNYTIPDVNDVNWGQNVTDFLVAIPAGVMPTAGTFPLTGDVSFGPTFGLVTAYFKSASPNIASTGSFRLSHSDSIAFRNNANTGDLLLSVDSADNILFNGSTFGVGGAVNAGLANQLGYYATSSNAISGLPLITGNRALISNGSGLPTASAVTNTEIGFVSGVTSSIQTQLNGKQASGSYAHTNLDNIASVAADVPMNGHKITGMADGIAPTDAATVEQLPVDSVMPGEVRMYCSVFPPTGWLVCNGQAISRTTFSALFAVTGTTYGSGDGSTTFNVPDFRNNVPVGAGSLASLGTAVGSQTHVLTNAEVPATTVTVSVTDPTHVHTQRVNLAGSGTGVGMTPTGPSATFQTTNINTVAAATGITASGTVNGGGGAHSIVQPSLGITFIIKT